jgi:hypothetical protein
MTRKKTEYQRFTQLTDGLLSVSHSEVKRKVEADKRAKERKKAKVSSASREGA